jgi:hypothetical protein
MLISVTGNDHELVYSEFFFLICFTDVCSITEWVISINCTTMELISHVLGSSRKLLSGQRSTPIGPCDV